MGGAVTYGPPQWPRPRKGYTLTHISFRPDGSVRSATFEPVAKARPVEEARPSRRGAIQETLL